MSEAKESFETIAGCKVQMLRGGKGAPLLFLHGAGGAGVWLPFFKTLAEKYDVIVPEHPGFGRSDTPEWLDNVGDFANFYLEFMDKLGLKAVNLVGTSLGGWIAADLAVRNSTKLGSLTLVAPAGIHVNGVPKGDIFLWTPEQAVRNLFADQALAEKVLAMQPDEEERRRKMKNALMLAKVGWQPRLYDPNLRKWLHRIDRKTLIVWGDSDKVIPPAYGPAYRDLIPGSRLEVLKNCGHLPHIEKAGDTAALIAKFIEEFGAMKFFMIHLMPYADIDLDYDKKHNSAWVTLPNTYFDPKKGPGLYNRFMDELVYADKVGFDGVCVNEHHQNAYGLMPIPGVIAGALARETKNVKIAVLGRALPLLTYPLSVAEEYAMLDNISGGRLIAGFVRGIGAEYHSTGINPAESHDRFHEAHDLIMQAWTKPGPSHYEGKYYHFDYVNTWPRPVQQPHPPIWIPSQGSSETINWASHPTRKYVYLQTFSPADQLKRFMDLYRAQANKYGYEASPQQLGWATPVYVADTDEQAKREAKAHIEAFYNKFLRMPFEMLIPPGYLSLASMQAVGDKARAAAAGSAATTIDSVMERGMFICGSPDSVAQQLEHHQKIVGYGKLIAMMQFGTLPHELTKRNMELFASKVMPKIRHLGEDDRPIKVEAAE